MNQTVMDIGANLNAISAYITFIVGNLVIFGFARSAWGPRYDPNLDPQGAGVRALGQAVFWGVGAYTYRMGYWDILQSLVSDETWMAIVYATGGQTVNFFWNLARLWAAYQALLALHYLLDDPDLRGRWPWWKVAFYPPWRITRMIVRAANAIREGKNQ